MKITAEEALLWSLSIWSRLAHSGKEKLGMLDKKELKLLSNYFYCPLCLKAKRKNNIVCQRKVDCLVWGKCGDKSECGDQEFGKWSNAALPDSQQFYAWKVFDRILETYLKMFPQE